MYFVSPDWNPAVEDQAVARCHRIGQTKKVVVYRFVMSDFIHSDTLDLSKTIENRINSVQENKRGFYI